MIENYDDYISISNCIHGGLYLLESRNLSIGIFNEVDSSFIGIRRKFKFRFLDSELHWDKCEKYGTAKPLKFLEYTEFKDFKNDDNYDIIFNYIDQKQTEIEGN
ncbi:MAG: hypothetical protein ACOC2W_01840 [bacterium]